MKLSKKKVTALALAVCLIAILSFSSLAWFTDDDSVKNDFLIAGSEDDNPEDIFSVDVWEEGDDDKDDGLTFEDILPGDTLSKIAHVKNTGSYDQYIRVKITVSDAKVWQEVYQANMVPVTEFVNVDKVNAWSDVYADENGNVIHSALEGDNFVYYLYYKTALKPDDEETTEVDPGDFTVFSEAYISGYLTKEQAVELNKDGVDGFTIHVAADAVQTKNVGANVYEAFKTVGMEIPLNTTFVATLDELRAAWATDGYVVMTSDITLTSYTETVGADVNLYLDECTLTAREKESHWANYYRFGLKTTKTLTIGGHGTVVLPGDRGIIAEGELNIYGGTYVDENNRNYNTTKNETLIAVMGGAANIYGGTFSGADHCVLVESGTADVYGGEFAVSSANSAVFSGEVSDHRS